MDADWDEVERMAAAASADDAQLASKYPTADVIERWTSLFGYSPMEAVHLITDQRGDVTRERISNEHWMLIKDEKEACGHDRESYEHSLQLRKLFEGQSASIPMPGTDGDMILLFRLGGLLDSPEKVKDVAGLQKLPVVLDGMNESGPVRFCAVDADARKKLEEWLIQQAVLG